MAAISSMLSHRALAARFFNRRSAVGSKRTASDQSHRSSGKRRTPVTLALHLCKMAISTRARLDNYQVCTTGTRMSPCRGKPIASFCAVI